MHFNHNCYYEKIGNSEPVKLEDLPFNIPENWTWIKFPNLVNFVLGKTPERHNPKYWNDGKYPWFSIADMKDKKTVYETKEKVSECSLIENFNSSLSLAGTLIMSFKLTVGRVSILGVDAVHNEAIISIFPYLNANNSIRDWLFYTLGLIVEYVDQTDAIKGSTLNKEKMSSMLIPLPPLNEQNRIISKLLIAEPLIADYDKLENKLSILEAEFPEKLKKSILQYAIEGKLVKQDPNDEPASVLLERIKAEKEKLIKEGKIKRDKNESYIYQGDDKNYYEKKGGCITKLDDEFIFSLSQNMPKQRFKTVLNVRDGTHESPLYHSSGYPFISSKNLINGKIDYENIKYISKDDFDKYNIRSNAEENDILFGMIGTIGNPAIIKNPPFKFAFKNMALIKLNKKYFHPEFVYYYLLWIERKFRQEATGGIQQFISLDYIRNSIIPIPSLNYQIKVVKLIGAILSL